MPTTVTRLVAAFVVALGLSGLSRASDSDANPLAIVPRPAQMTVTPNTAPFTLDAHAQIVTICGDMASDAVAVQLQNMIEADTGLRIPIHSGQKSIDLRQGPAIVVDVADFREEFKSLGAEGYRLKIDHDSVTIGAHSAAGAFYGCETLRQIIPAAAGVAAKSFALPALTIEDHPRFPERSIMLDSARHFQSIAFLKRTLDLLAYHKLNTFHWHLTDDQGWRLEIKRYPKLTEVGAFRVENGKPYGGFYTQAQVREIVAYAAERHITIVPEIDMPAHCQSLMAAYPEYACFPRAFKVPTNGISNDTPGGADVLNVGREETFTFLQNILDEVMILFPSRAIHIGGDECPTGDWERNADCQAKIKELGLPNARALQSWFTNRIAAYLSRHQRHLQGWNEIMDGGNLPKDVIVEPWNRAESAAKAARAGNDVVVASTRYGYFDYGYNSISLARAYEWNPMPPGLTDEEAGRIQGLEACLWTEGKRNDADADTFLWPRAIAVAEDGWSPQDLRDWSDFKRRLRNGHYAHLARMGLGDPAQTNPTAIATALIERSDFNPGVKIGVWTPAQMSETFVTRDWDVTGRLTGPGKYVVRLQYDAGADGIAASEIDLVRNGTDVIAIDAHDAFAGANSHGQRFTLDVPAFDPTAKYVLRVRLRSDGGTDSRGSLFLIAPESETVPALQPNVVR